MAGPIQNLMTARDAAAQRLDPSRSNRVWGGDSEQHIDDVNQSMRSQPWYQQYLRSIGQDPSSVHLSKPQAQQLLKLAQANGVVVDEGKIEMDPGGNFNPIGHKMRNFLIGAGIAGAALTGGAALGAFGGSGAAGAGAGTAGAGAGSAGALGGGSTLAANLGAASALPAVAGGGAAALVPATITGLTTPGVGAAATTTGLGAAAPAASHGIFSSLVAPALIKGGASAVNGILAHNAAGKATDQLVNASERAQQINQQVYNDVQSKYAPFISGGQGAFGLLTQGVGVPQSAPISVGSGQTPAAAANTGAMVQLRAPNGQIKAVPPDQAQHFISMGAQRVN